MARWLKYDEFKTKKFFFFFTSTWHRPVCHNNVPTENWVSETILPKAKMGNRIKKIFG